jgi:hypothetical protein
MQCNSASPKSKIGHRNRLPVTKCTYAVQYLLAKSESRMHEQVTGNKYAHKQNNTAKQNQNQAQEPVNKVHICSIIPSKKKCKTWHENRITKCTEAIQDHYCQAKSEIRHRYFYRLTQCSTIQRGKN